MSPPNLIIEVIDGIAIEGFIASVNIGASASSQLRAVGNVGAVAWTVDSGALPPGWTLGASTGLVAGTAADAGSYSVTIRATDSGGRFTRRLFVFRVQALPLSLTGTLPTMGFGEVYFETLTASGGLPPYTVIAATLPAGIAPSVAGANVGVGGASTSGEGVPAGTTGSFAASITLQDSVGATTTWTQSLAYEVPALVCTISSLPDGVEDQAYSGDVNAVGGVGGFVFSLDTKPAWMSINSSTGALTGTPASGDIGTGISVVARVTDAEANTDTDSGTMDVTAPGFAFEILARSPWGYWKLNETGTLTTAVDSSGNGRDGTWVGTNNAAGSALFSGSTGCATISLANARVNLPTDTRAANAPFSILCAIVSTGSGIMQIVSADSGSLPARAIQFRKSAADLEAVLILPSVVTLNVSTSMNSATPSIIAMVFDPSESDANGKLKLYRNGVEVDRTTTSISNNQTSYPWAIASRSNAALNGGLIGSISDVAIYHTALSAADIAAIYAARNIL